MTKNKTPTLDDLLQKIKHGDSKQYYSSEWGKQAILQWVADEFAKPRDGVEVRSLDDTWFVKSFSVYHSDDEVKEAIEQFKDTLAVEQLQILKDHGWKG